MPYEPRTYRNLTSRSGLRFFSVQYLETDLWLGVDEACYNSCLPDLIFTEILEMRQSLDRYGLLQPLFLSSFRPMKLLPAAPPLAIIMAEAAFAAGVGPMAAVAGAFAQATGELLLLKYGAREVIVENGGDIYLNTQREATVGIFAGNSPLSQKLALRITTDQMPIGICTSSGTVGPSISFGMTDATVTLAKSAALADAFASNLANRVQTKTDLNRTLAVAHSLPGLLGCIIIIGDQVGAWGNVEFVAMN